MINRLEAGVYSIGETMSNQTIVGTRDRPIIFRAAQNASDPWGPPVRATINGSIFSTHGHDHIWCEHGLVFPTSPGSEKPRAGRWWGVEVTDVGGSTATDEDWTGSGVATTTHDGGGNDVIVTENITADTTWTSDNNYLLGGPIWVVDGATLTIEPGTTVYGYEAEGAVTPGALVITRGSH